MKVYLLCFTLYCLFILSCGLPHHTNGTKRIIAGEPARIEDYPYYVYLRIVRGQYQYGCGGTLVRANRVITAGHCIWNTASTNIFVYAGLRSRSEIASTTPYRVASVVIHSSYNGRNHPNYDIAVIKLASNVALSQRVRPINMATSRPIIGSTVTVVGYGNTFCQRDGIGGCVSVTANAANTLQRTNVAVLWYTDNVMVTKGFLGIRSTCHGDSGGPFIYRNQLVGVVSTGQAYCRGLNFEASVADYRDFLLQHM